MDNFQAHMLILRGIVAFLVNQSFWWYLHLIDFIHLNPTCFLESSVFGVVFGFNSKNNAFWEHSFRDFNKPILCFGCYRETPTGQFLTFSVLTYTSGKLMRLMFSIFCGNTTTRGQNHDFCRWSAGSLRPASRSLPALPRLSRWGPISMGWSKIEISHDFTVFTNHWGFSSTIWQLWSNQQLLGFDYTIDSDGKNYFKKNWIQEQRPVEHQHGKLLQTAKNAKEMTSRTIWIRPVENMATHATSKSNTEQ